jgi:aldehyde dehydrogenase (NAD+)
MSKLLPPTLQDLGLRTINPSTFISNIVPRDLGIIHSVNSPIDNKTIAKVHHAPSESSEVTIQASLRAFKHWRDVPAPIRGHLIQEFANQLRLHKKTLAQLVTLEVGKIPSEAEGEVQEMIDICEFAVGLSRQLHGLTIASERTHHRLMEQWHPLGPTAIITAFNFPVAVWAWNAVLALVCGNSIIWKPSSKAPLSAIACQHILQLSIDKSPEAPAALSSLIIGDRGISNALASSPHIPLVSATGSVSMGRSVGTVVAQRLGRSLLELGGNNAMIVTANANIDLAARAILFSAVGTAGQRCTSLRRLIIHDSIASNLLLTLKSAYATLSIGDPRELDILVGPLIDEAAVANHHQAIDSALQQGGKLITPLSHNTAFPDGHYVQPLIIEMPATAPILQHETFSPILYVIRYTSLDDAIQLHNAVPQGLSSSIFTDKLQEAEHFLSATGSDCGIANVNIGTSGAEIGGAFGGEKETGGGRESGSDSWKNYMRRATNTINFGNDLPLAQGVEFY